MGNTNFQTIHQMGTAISDMVRQATGRDDVQNIDMEHITVAQNHSYEEIDLSGQVVSFQAGEAGIPFEKLAVQIEPVQDLHGYDSPWPAGGGKNKAYRIDSVLPMTINGITVSADGTDGVKATGTASATIGFNVFEFPVESGKTYTVSFGMTIVSGVYVNLPKFSNGTNVGNAGGINVNIPSFTFTADDTFDHVRGRVTVDGGINANGIVIMIQAEEGSTATSWTPYSNICPITGWTMVNVYQAGENMEDARVYRFTFPSEAGIVYGGTLDAISGELVVDRASYTFTGTEYWQASYTPNRFYVTHMETYLPFVPANQTMVANAEQNVLTSAFGRCVYKNADGVAYIVSASDYWQFVVNEPAAETVGDIKAIIAGTQIVYELATPFTFHLTPQQITTLLGQNYIWADTGDTEVKFTNVKELY